MVHGAGSRNKGHNGEREFCRLLEKVVGFDVSRNVDQVRDGGADIIAVRPFAIEVKRQESLNLNVWWKQALSQRKKTNPIAVLVWKQNRKPWNVRIEGSWLVKKKLWDKSERWVQLDLETFLMLIKKSGKP